MKLIEIGPQYYLTLKYSHYWHDGSNFVVIPLINLDWAMMVHAFVTFIRLRWWCITSNNIHYYSMLQGSYVTMSKDFGICSGSSHWKKPTGIPSSGSHLGLWHLQKCLSWQNIYGIEAVVAVSHMAEWKMADLGTTYHTN